ncbi:nucleoside deaminase [Clostridium rectalis]|uniref:nucleoside deaminase n=1 Tax=Clostridium rectalis TaxID=2040295 RepID=UPI000F63DE0E|nr:nucleoside deaminase [Clostridium rectalis]
MLDFMNEAIIEAKKAYKLGEVPVGAVIVKDDIVIARAYNMREKLKDPTAHAEIMVIKTAAKVLENWRLNGCHMYVTLEPCPMCAGAIVQSRISKIYIGTFDEKSGCCGSILNLLQNKYLNSDIEVSWMYNRKCGLILEEFFKEKRKGKK